MNTSGAIKLTPADPAPDRIWDATVYLYLCVFSQRLKVGVTAVLHERRLRHQRAAGEIAEAVYAIRMDRRAWSVERAIKRRFGEREAVRGHYTEWFGREHLAEALRMMGWPVEERA